MSGNGDAGSEPKRRRWEEPTPDKALGATPQSGAKAEGESQARAPKQRLQLGDAMTPAAPREWDETPVHGGSAATPGEYGIQRVR